MDRRRFVRSAAGIGAGGALGWAARGIDDHFSTAAHEESLDDAGVNTGRAGAYGLHRVIYSVSVTEPVVALTFDDGPDPEFTPRVLEILAGYGITATFNLMGYNAEQHPDIVRSLVEAGHEFGNHTWSHRDLSTTSMKETASEIRRGRQAIEALTGQKIRYFRPPRGELSGAALRYVAEDGYDLLMWSITGSIAGHEEPKAVDDFVESKLQGGAIVDFHDGIGRGTFDRSNSAAKTLIARRRAEVDGLPRLLETAMGKGFRFVSVTELLSHEVGPTA